MNCRNFHRNLEDYLDGGLDFTGRLGIERHAEQCFACGKELADARALPLLIKSLSRVKAPADFESRVCREIAVRKSRGIFARIRNYISFGFEWRRFALTSAICAALTFGFFAAQRFSLPDAQVQEIAENSNPAVEEAAFGDASEDFKMEEFKPEDFISDDFIKDALDLLLVGPNNHHTPERLPRQIYVRYGPPSEEYFIRNVSH